MAFCLIYISFRFLIDNGTERLTQFIFFTISILYLFNILIDDYKRVLTKDYIIEYLIIIFAIVSICVSKVINFVSIRALLMLVINFIGITVDDVYDKENL